MRTIVVTGASSGVGLEAAKQLAALGDQLVVVGRDPRRLGAAMAEIRAVATGPEPDEVRADFAVLDEVRRLAEHVLATYEKVDVLANNAGGMLPERRTTRDGFEATIQANHLGGFLLTHLLRERLSGGRVIFTASDAHRGATVDPDDFTFAGRRWASWPVYGVTKAQNVMVAAEAARRWPDVLTVSFHPGVVSSNFGAGRLTRFAYKAATPFLTTPRKAGALLAWLATTPAGELTNGAYYEGHRTKPIDRRSDDPALQSHLWESSAKAVGL